MGWDCEWDGMGGWDGIVNGIVWSGVGLWMGWDCQLVLKLNPNMMFRTENGGSATLFNSSLNPFSFISPAKRV